MAKAKTWASEWRVVLEFAAGFAATIFFHQPALWILHQIGLTPRTPYGMTPVPPFGVPSALSLAFWGGIWALIMIPLISRIRSEGAYWAAAALFGAIAPTLVAWFVVAPLKHQLVTFRLPGVLVPLIINAVWGLGTAGLFRFFARTK